jgi:hypothetical protein
VNDEDTAWRPLLLLLFAALRIFHFCLRRFCGDVRSGDGRTTRWKKGAEDDFNRKELPLIRAKRLMNVGSNLRSLPPFCEAL